MGSPKRTWRMKVSPSSFSSAAEKRVLESLPSEGKSMSLAIALFKNDKKINVSAAMNFCVKTSPAARS